MLGRPESMIMGREVILSGSVQQVIDLLVWITIQHFHKHKAASPTYSVGQGFFGGRGRTVH